MELDHLDQLAASVFDGYLVRKDLVRQYSRQYPVPTYVVEFLLGRYCATVDEHEIRDDSGHRESGDRPVHREKRSLEDVQPVDLGRRSLSERPGGRALADPGRKLHAPRRGEGLRIRKARRRRTGDEDHYGCHHRPGEGSPARFVHAGDDVGDHAGRPRPPARPASASTAAAGVS